MKFKTEIIERIKGRDDLKNKLVSELRKSRYSIWRYISENEDDGPLTRVKAIEIISSELNVPTNELFVETETVNA